MTNSDIDIDIESTAAATISACQTRYFKVILDKTLFVLKHRDYNEYLSCRLGSATGTPHLLNLPKSYNTPYCNNDRLRLLTDLFEARFSKSILHHFTIPYNPTLEMYILRRSWDSKDDFKKAVWEDIFDGSYSGSNVFVREVFIRFIGNCSTNDKKLLSNILYLIGKDRKILDIINNTSKM